MITELREEYREAWLEEAPLSLSKWAPWIQFFLDARPSYSYKLRMRFFKGLLATLALANALFSVSCAEGSVFIVTDTNDTTRIDSLRGAIIAANSRGREPKNTIILGSTESPRRTPSGFTFYLTIPGPDETNALTGDLNIIRGDLTIVGMGKNVTIDARSLGDRVFHVHKNAKLTLANVAITGAHAGSGAHWVFGGEPGGAVYNEGTLTIVDCLINGNSSGEGGYTEGNGGQPPGGVGGGICNIGTMTLTHCLLTSNFCGGLSSFGGGGDGGGVWNSGIASLDSCIIEGNAAAGPQVVQGMGGDGGSGGGVYNTGILNLNKCTMRRNFSGGGASGGLPDWGSVFDPGGPGGAGGNGGGVYNSGKLELDWCVVSDNSTGNGGDGGDGPLGGGDGGSGGAGGAIFSTGTLILNGCTVNGNLTGNGGNGGSALFTGATGAEGGSGGGICSLGTLTLTNCTISGNATGSGGSGGQGRPNGASGGAGGSGGGIYAAGSLSFISCTVCSNATGTGGAGGGGSLFAIDIDPGAQSIASGGGGGNGGSGGGVFSTTNLPPKTANSLIAFNHSAAGGVGGPGYTLTVNTNTDDFDTTNTVGDAGSPGSGPDLSGTFLSLGFNLISQAEGSAGFTQGLKSDLLGSIAAPINPLLGPLQMNGGPTPTHALLPGSPAIDQGKSFGVHSDQRGHHRPHDYPLVSNALGGDGSDIGAFELDLIRLGSTVLSGMGGAPLAAPRGGRFQFQVTAPSDQETIIQWSDDLLHWIDIGCVTGTAAFTDTNAAAQPIGFYRKKP
jgi:hypothetical protein